MRLFPTPPFLAITEITMRLLYTINIMRIINIMQYMRYVRGPGTKGAFVEGEHRKRVGTGVLLPLPLVIEKQCFSKKNVVLRLAGTGEARGQDGPASLAPALARREAVLRP